MGKYFTDGKLYRPSNGTEGMIFMDNYCDQCIHECPFENSKKKCEIITLTMCLDTNDKDYPKEWQYKDDTPICTKFQKWDWGNDGDPDDLNNPKAPPPPPDPNQLHLFPLYPDETHFIGEPSVGVGLKNVAHTAL